MCACVGKLICLGAKNDGFEIRLKNARNGELIGVVCKAQYGVHFSPIYTYSIVHCIYFVCTITYHEDDDNNLHTLIVQS